MNKLIAICLTIIITTVLIINMIMPYVGETAYTLTQVEGTNFAYKLDKYTGEVWFINPYESVEIKIGGVENE